MWVDEPPTPRQQSSRRGRCVFHGDDDYGLFLDKLARPVETFRVSLRAFCLMPNHLHL